ncbi:winged helix-turn-helix domain-containing protein [Microlunatus sp. GCM10028923]|uniref:winged helix-turn-helix domain-containing protein n=1 Tax=Microlunatus sp. GCM10028923 TaxID=3273400 RepID=UPI00361FC4D8
MPTASTLSKTAARRIWMRAQRLDTRAPFGAGPEATRAAVEHLGYVQIDTIHVIERCHHHILWSRIPEYRRADLHRAQTIDKSVFEFWTHALAYVPTRDFRFSVPAMLRDRRHPAQQWFGTVTEDDVRRVLRLIKNEGALTIRDIKDDVLVEKTHAWASRKPSKSALQVAFSRGQVTVSERIGMVKTYELLGRHFGWDKLPRPATERQQHAHRLDRALTAQGVVSIDSTCHLQRPPVKAAVQAEIDTRVKRGRLVPVIIDGAEKVPHWAEPATLDATPDLDQELVHVLSPFDPLIILRKRLARFFDYEHVFEAYVPKAKRRYGYFALPVLVGDEVVAVIDLKTDRDRGTLLVQQWTWVGRGAERRHRASIEAELERFERFQLAS